MDQDRGLLKFIRDTFLKAEAERPVPDLRKDRDGWYRLGPWTLAGTNVKQ